MRLKKNQMFYCLDIKRKICNIYMFQRQLEALVQGRLDLPGAAAAGCLTTELDTLISGQGGDH